MPLELLLRQPDGAAQLLVQMAGAPLASFARGRPELLEKMLGDLLAGIATVRHAPPPKPTQGLAAGYEGIEHAQLVVIYVHGDREGERGEGLAAETPRLRKDEAVFNDILGYRGNKKPVTVTVAVANLLDARDPGRKKALARVRRALRAGAPETKNEGTD